MTKSSFCAIFSAPTLVTFALFHAPNFTLLSRELVAQPIESKKASLQDAFLDQYLNTNFGAHSQTDTTVNSTDKLLKAWDTGNLEYIKGLVALGLVSQRRITVLVALDLADPACT